MTVPEQIPVVNYVADGVVKKFDVPFEYDQQSDLHLYVDGVEPTIDKYFFADNAFNFYIAPTVGQDVKIKRITPKERDTDYDLHTNTVRPKALNSDFDRLWYVLQEVFSDVGGLSQAVQDEIIARIQGDEDLLNQLTAEISARMLGDEAVTEDLKNYVNQVVGAIIGDPSFTGIDAKNVNDASGETQQQVNYNGGAKWHSRAGGYLENERVVLANGDIVKSTVDGNTNDPNVDMTGWTPDDAARNTIKLQREFVSVWDFFTDSEIQAYNLAIINGSLSSFDCATQVQAFADYIAANDVGTAYCSATVYTSQGIVLGGASGCATKEVIGNLNIRALTGSSGHTLFLMQCGQDFKWLGSINPMGLGGGIFNSRTWRRGLVLGGQYQCAHTYIGSVSASNGFSEYGVLFDDLTTSSDIGQIRVTRCGSGYKLPSHTEENATWTDKATFSIVSENITTGTTQSTTIQLSKMPLPDLRFNPTLYINGSLYNVSSMDYATSQMTIFPLLDRTITTGTARFVYGAGVCTAGSDASIVRFGNVNSTNNGVIYHSGALYPAIIYGTQTGQSNFIDVLLGGNSVSQAHVGGATISLYMEDSVFNLVRRTRAQLNWANLTNVAFNLSKFYDLTRVRSPSDNTLDKTSVGMEGILVAENGRWLVKENRGIAANDVKTIDVTDTNRSEYWHYGTSKTFDIVAPDMSRLELLGYNRKSCILMGTNDAGSPTGNVVFNAPAGYTVNGGTSATFNGFTQAARFDVYLQYVRNNFVVTCSTLPSVNPSSSVTYDPPSIAAGATVSTTVTLTGAALGNIVQAAFSRYNADIEISAQVSATNTITVKFRNIGTGAVDLASGTLTVKII